MAATSPGEYIVSIAARSGDGSFDARALRGLFWSADQEYRTAGVNNDLLSRLSRATGGTVLHDDANAFSKRPRGYRDAGSWLLVAGFLLFFADVIAPSLVAIARRVLGRTSSPAERAAA